MLTDLEPTSKPSNKWKYIGVGVVVLALARLLLWVPMFVFSWVWSNLPILLGAGVYGVGVGWLIWAVITDASLPPSNDYYARSKHYESKVYAILLMVIGGVWFGWAWSSAHPSVAGIDDATSCIHRGGVADQSMRPVDGQHYSVHWTRCKDGYSFNTP